VYLQFLFEDLLAQALIGGFGLYAIVRILFEDLFGIGDLTFILQVIFLSHFRILPNIMLGRFRKAGLLVVVFIIDCDLWRVLRGATALLTHCDLYNLEAIIKFQNGILVSYLWIKLNYDIYQTGRQIKLGFL